MQSKLVIAALLGAISAGTIKEAVQTQALQKAEYSSDQMRLAQVEQGVIKAYGGSIDVFALLVCIGDEDKGLLMLDMAVQAFIKAVKYDTDPADKLGDFIGSIMCVVGGLQTMKQGLPACENIKKSGFDFNKIDTSINIENLKTIEENVVQNEATLRADMEAAIEAHEREDYVQFGYYFGKILETATEKPKLEETKALQKPEYSSDQMRLAQVEQGIIKAYGGDIDIWALLVCIADED